MNVPDIYNDYDKKINCLVDAFHILAEYNFSIKQKNPDIYKKKIKDLYDSYKQNSSEFNIYGEVDKIRVFTNKCKKILEDFIADIKIPKQIVYKPEISTTAATTSEVKAGKDRLVPLYVIPEGYSIVKNIE